MPRRQAHQTKSAEVHTHITVRIESYEASATASINHSAYAPEYAWTLDDNDPVYEFSNQVRLSGTSTYPPERAGDVYELTFYGDDAPSRRLHQKLKDLQVRDEYGSPKYKQYRGRQVPILVPPNGIGIVDKVRGERRWSAWLVVMPRFVGDLLVLLTCRSENFLALHEYKIERSRWIRSVTIQTNDPAQD